MSQSTEMPQLVSLLVQTFLHPLEFVVIFNIASIMVMNMKPHKSLKHLYCVVEKWNIFEV